MHVWHQQVRALIYVFVTERSAVSIEPLNDQHQEE